MTRTPPPIFLLAAALLLLLGLAACTSPAPAGEGTAFPTPAATPTPRPAPTSTPASPTAPADTPAPPPEPAATSAPQAESSPTPASQPPPGPETAVARALAAFAQPAQTEGEILILFGQVLDRNGDPIPGAAVEIWQTDAAGVYDHPGDPGTATRARDFQFYGTSLAAADGFYRFRTILPGEYEPRPRHIHVKVRLDGRELLTTQFYFSQDRVQVEDEGIFRTAGDRGEQLLLQLGEARDVAGQRVLLARGDLVIDRGEGSLSPTPAQAEGPYYPVVDVAAYDNDLAVP